MSSPYTFRVGDFLIVHGTRDPDPELLVPFQPSDLKDRYDAEELFFGFEAPASIVARRLDILGFTIPAAAKAYSDGLTHYRKEYGEFPWPCELSEWQATVSSRAERIAALESRVAPAGDFEWDETVTEDPAFIERMVWSETLLGFPGGDIWHVVRALLGTLNGDTRICYDLTDTLGGGYVQREGTGLWSVDPRVPVVILTEGKSDARLLRLALDTLFPDFADYFRFLDYDFAKAAGGVGEVVRFVKMFAGSGITNRIVALFDNDAAGHQALSELGSVPANVFPMCLPSLEAFKNYPTLGPDGTSMSSIDGRACSLEMYLGPDALKDEAGNLRPVRWTGYNERIGRYHGEISGKGQVQAAFENILGIVRRDPAERAKYDLAAIEAVFEAIFSKLASR